MRSETDTKVYQFNKRKMALVMIGCIAFVALGVFLIFVNANLLESITGVVSILFFGFGLVIYTRNILRGNAGLVIDSSGIYDSTTIPAAGKIPWSEIRSIRVKYQTMAIELLHPEEYLERKRGISKWLAGLNKKIYGTPAIISLSTLNINEICDDIIERLNKYDQSN
jgi:hypothetical protein